MFFRSLQLTPWWPRQHIRPSSSVIAQCFSKSCTNSSKPRRQAIWRGREQASRFKSGDLPIIRLTISILLIPTVICSKLWPSESKTVRMFSFCARQKTRVTLHISNNCIQQMRCHFLNLYLTDHNDTASMKLIYLWNLTEKTIKTLNCHPRVSSEGIKNDSNMFFSLFRDRFVVRLEWNGNRMKYLSNEIPHFGFVAHMKSPLSFTEKF